MHNKIVVLAETPLQILCAYSTINSIENIFLFICGENRGGSRNLIKILFNNIKVHNIRNFFVLLKIVTKCVLHHGKINKLYIGDMRSIYNLLLIFIIRPNNIILLDDGYGSIVIDETRDISIHCNFVFIKKLLLFLIKYENINRVTIYSHPININYKTIERINLKLFDREFSIDHNYKSIFYIESPMDGLMSYTEQVKLFKIIGDYKLNKDQKLYYICHRKSNIESDPFFKDNDNKPIFLENEYPIECYFKYFNNIDCKVIFFVTSALLSAIGRIDREKLVIIDTNMFKFNSQSKDLISQFVRFKQYQITHAKKNNK